MELHGDEDNYRVCGALLDWLVLPSPSSSSSSSASASAATSSSHSTHTSNSNSASHCVSSAVSPAVSSVRPILSQFQFLDVTQDYSTISYAIAISEGKGYLPLHYFNFFQQFLTLQSSVDIYSLISTEKSIGNISGQISSLSRYFPFASILILITKYKLNSLTITGFGWSGTIAHNITIILREFARSIRLKIPIRCVSFSGPLCGSKSVEKYLFDNNFLDFHLTINSYSSVYDRLLLNYQQLSLLYHSEIDDWRSIYEFIYSSLVRYNQLSFSPSSVSHVTDLNLSLLSELEDLLYTHPVLKFFDSQDEEFKGDTKEKNLQILYPLGKYLFFTIGEETHSPSSTLCRGNGKETMDYLRHLDGLTFSMIPRTLSLSSYLSSPLRDSVPQIHHPISFMQSSPSLSLTPNISSVQIIQYPHHTSFLFEGLHLDTILCRDMINDIPLSLSNASIYPLFQPIPTDLPVLPFFLASTSSILLNQTAKIHVVRSIGPRLVIDVTGLSITSNPSSMIDIGVRNDFGESNTLSFSTTRIQISKDKDENPSSIHPIMNTSFLVSTLLRVAVCMRASSVTNFESDFPQLNRVWNSLVDMEKMCEYSSPIFQVEMNHYALREYSLNYLQNIVKKRVENMISIITSYHENEDEKERNRERNEGERDGERREREESMTRFIPSPRRVIGGLSRLTGGLISTAGVILTVPSMLLSLPALLYITRQNREPNTSLQIGIGPGIYLSLMGLLSLPGVIVTGLGSVLSAVGKNIMKEDNETSNYRKLLYEIISLLDIDVQREKDKERKRDMDNSTSSSDPDKSIEYIIDEIIPLENYVMKLWSQLYPLCDITSSTVTPQSILEHLQQTTKKQSGENREENSNEVSEEMKRLISQKLLRNYKKNPTLFIKLKFIGYVYRIRAVFESNLYISLFGTTNASKSLLLKRLFEGTSNRSYSHISSDPIFYRIGDWIERYSMNPADGGDSHDIFRSWLSDHDRDSLQLYVLDHPFIPIETAVTNTEKEGSETENSESIPSLSSSILSLTSTAEYMSLSSLVLLHVTESPHQITTHTLHYFTSIRSSQKPFLIIIDLTHKILDHDDLPPRTPGEYESLKEAYSREFENVSIDLIHFIDGSQESIDRLRGLVYGMGQNLLVSSWHTQLLALRLIPSKIIQKLLDEDRKLQNAESKEVINADAISAIDILSFPDVLCSATTSLLYNLSPLTAESLRASCQHFWNERNSLVCQEPPEKVTKSLQSLPFNISLQIQQIAITLQISENIYSLFHSIFTAYFNLFTDSFQTILSSLSASSTQNLNPQILLIYHILMSNKQISRENILSLFILLFLRQQINHYLGIQNTHPKIGDKDQMNVSYLCTEILLGLQIWVNTWTERGYSSPIVEKGVAMILTEREVTSTFILSLSPASSSSHGITDREFLQVINRLQNTSTYFQFSPSYRQPNPDNEDSTKDIEVYGGEIEKTKRLIEFQLARDQYAQIMKIISFQPFPQLPFSSWTPSSSSTNSEESQNLLEDHELALERYQEAMKEYTQQHNQTIKIVLSRNTDILLHVLEQLMSYTYQDMKKSSFLFTVMSESAIDLNGVTRSIITQLAIEINTQPHLLSLERDEDSQLIYFDPEKFISRSIGGKEREIEHLHTMYTSFGKLIGLCIVKASVGVTFPVDFPLTFYRLILGYRLNMDDLMTIHPQIATSLMNICLMDEETLELSCLDFTITLSDHSVHELIPNGSNNTVTIHNRVEYIKKTLQYYLCCSENQLSNSTEVSTHSQSDFNSLSPHSSPLLSFLFGIQSICSRHYFHHMSPTSLQLLIEGNRKNLNVKEWKESTEYRFSGSSLFTTPFNPNDLQTNLPAVSAITSLSSQPESTGNENQRTIELFWEIVSEMSESDKRKLLCFTVGTTSLPSNGFQGLQPKFTVVVGTIPTNSLPISHTCFHMLILPKYETKDIMRAKIYQAINETGVSDLGIV